MRRVGRGREGGGGGLFGVGAIGGALALSAVVARRRYRICAGVLGAGAAVAIVTSQGRGVIVAAVATALAYGVMAATSQRRIASLAGLVVAGAVAYFVVTSILTSAGKDAFRYQGLSASKIIETTSGSRGRPGQLHTIGATIVTYPLGVGLGTAGPAGSTAGG